MIQKFGGECVGRVAGRLHPPPPSTTEPIPIQGPLLYYLLRSSGTSCASHVREHNLSSHFKKQNQSEASGSPSNWEMSVDISLSPKPWTLHLIRFYGGLRLIIRDP